MRWLRESMQDEDGQYDVAYVSLLGVALSTVGVGIPAACGIALYGVYRHADKAGEIVSSLGIGIGAVAGGFATALGALAAYMMATRKRKEV